MFRNHCCIFPKSDVFCAIERRSCVKNSFYVSPPVLLVNVTSDINAFQWNETTEPRGSETPKSEKLCIKKCAIILTQISLFFMGKRAASVHSFSSSRLDCLRNAVCVCNNTAFVRSSSSTAVFIRIPLCPLLLRCAPPLDSQSLIWHQASPQSKTLSSAGTDRQTIASEGTRPPR